MSAECTGCCKHLLSLYLLSLLFLFVCGFCVLFTHPAFTNLGPSASDRTHKGRKEGAHVHPKEPPRRNPRTKSPKYGVQVLTSCAHTALLSQQTQGLPSPRAKTCPKPGPAQRGLLAKVRDTGTKGQSHRSSFSPTLPSTAATEHI